MQFWEQEACLSEKYRKIILELLGTLKSGMRCDKRIGADTAFRVLIVLRKKGHSFRPPQNIAYTENK